MSDFELFNQALSEYNKNIKKCPSDLPSESPDPLLDSPELPDSCQEENKGTGSINKCTHEETALEKGIIICINCGEEITKKIQHTKEWRYYSQSDNRHSSDPNRVQIRKSDERNIDKDVENMGFSDKIIREANKIYFQVTGDRIYRGNSRKAIVFACIFHSYKLTGKPQSHERLINVFDLNRKTGLKGLKHVNLHAPKNSSIRTTYITPVNLIEEIMNKFQATQEQKTEVVELYNKIKNKSSRLNRSRPQSVSAGLIYYYIRLKNKNITLKQFTKKVSLSELTVNKIAKEIGEVLGTPNIM